MKKQSIKMDRSNIDRIPSTQGARGSFLVGGYFGGELQRNGKHTRWLAYHIERAFLHGFVGRGYEQSAPPFGENGTGGPNELSTTYGYFQKSTLRLPRLAH